jgi:hypothetical protein
MLYDFDLTENATQYAVSGPKFQLVLDITKNVRFKKEFMDQIGFYEIYRLADGETLEHVSEKLYGTPDYHWLIMLLNQRYDYIEDYPVEGFNLDQVVKNKYGDRGEDAHHYTNGNGDTVNVTAYITLTNPPSTTVVGRTMFQELAVGQIIRRKTSLGTYVGRIEEVDIPNKKVKVYITNGEFKKDDPVQIYKYYDNAAGQFTEELLASPVVTGFTLENNVSVVTNYEYEYYINERKRLIRVVPQQYIQQIINEFETIFNK